MQTVISMALEGRNRLVDGLALVVTLGGTLAIAHLVGAEATWWLLPYLMAVMLAARMVCLGFHELGHLLAGEFVGWTWQVFKLGPLLLSREDGSLRASLGGARRFRAAGLVVTRPLFPECDTPGRRMIMLAGGPAASALLSVLAGIWIAALQPSLLPCIAIAVTALYSGVVLVTSVLPFDSAGHPSDGKVILSLLRLRSQRRNGHAPEISL